MTAEKGQDVIPADLRARIKELVRISESLGKIPIESPFVPTRTVPMELVPSDIATRVAELTERDVRIIGLIASGLLDPQIAKIVFLSAGTIKNHITKHIIPFLGLKGRGELVLFYVRYMLPMDLHCEPTAPRGYLYVRPGLKWAAWQKAAERTRAMLYGDGVLTPRRIQVATLHADPLHTDKSDAEMAKLVRVEAGEPEVTCYTVKNDRNSMVTDWHGGAKLKLTATVALAPFELRAPVTVLQAA